MKPLSELVLGLSLSGTAGIEIWIPPPRAAAVGTPYCFSSTPFFPMHFSFAACWAEFTTLPLDTAKVRLQLQDLSLRATPKYTGPLQAIIRMVREEGYTAPFKGLSPGLQRQFVFTGLRLGLYDDMKRLFAAEDDQNGSVLNKAAAATLTSAAGITLANPADVCKVRFQRGTSVEGAPVYRGTLDAYRRIAREEGVIKGLYRGYHANLLRSCIISSAELVTYDTAKAMLLQWGYKDGTWCHITSGLTAGLVATLLGSPADVLGTRLVVQSGDTKSSIWSLAAKMLKEEGLSSFYKGFVPNFARIGSFNVVMWLTYEQLNSLFLGISKPKIEDEMTLDPGR